MDIESTLKINKSFNTARKTVVNTVYTGNWIFDKLSEFLKHYDLTVQQYNVLRILNGQTGKPMNLFEIQERMINKMSNTTRLIDKLLLKNYVTRVQCDENRRKIDIEITASGKLLLLKIAPLLDTYETQLVNKLSADELNTLNYLLDKLRSKIN